MIVVEGPDGAGKTTLIKKLAVHWQLPVADRVVGKDTKATVDVAAWVEENVARGWQSTIFDRHRLISEPIYGPILRGNRQDPHFLDAEWVRTKTWAFYQAQPILIYCLPPFEVVKSNCLNDPDNDNSAVVDKIAPIYLAYATRAACDMARSPRSTMVYDYTRRSHKVKPMADRFNALIDARRDW